MHLEVVLPRAVCKSILTTDLGTYPADLQGQAIRFAIEWSTPEKVGGTDGQRVSLLPDLWDQLYVWLREHGRHNAGATAEQIRRANSYSNLARKIRGKLQKLEGHPAYRCLAVMGVDTTVLSGWRFKPQRSYPLQRLALEYMPAGAELEWGILEPTTVKARGRVLTKWDFTRQSEETTRSTQPGHPAPSR